MPTSSSSGTTRPVRRSSPPPSTWADLTPPQRQFWLCFTRLTLGQQRALAQFIQELAQEKRS